ncbi:hypothetical protein BFJ71_g16731 [Fusarium oxysporum]|nr:hypothetical protein BFJ71_g16731 [Fusarium oxysporum]
MMDAVHTASEMSGASGDGQNPDYAEETRKRLDNKCLILMVSLLDHKLYGDVYDSIVVSFLAVMGIRQDVMSSNAQKLSEAAEFTPKLSALIKMGQLLVAERALLAVELDEADVPAHALEEMQDRFMTKDARSPISWSLKLRAYGKAVKDNTTSLGYITWSDDNEILSYKKMRFSMTGLRDLVSAEVEAAQNQLADLLLVPPDTERKHIVPQVSLRSVVDDPSEGAPGWNFTCHPQNEVLHGHRRWILDRILKEAFLRRDFFDNESTGKWRLQTVGRYLSTVNAFLERLLLLVHITGGQPARGTELLCLQHSNPRDGSGGRRNIFVENGLISFVTYYHKGYSVTGTTKIIHRYLPSNVGELLLYYVWLIVPFLSQLSQLVKIPGFKQGSTPYLWGEFSISQLLSSGNTKVQTLPYLQANDKEARKEKKKASRILQKLTTEKAETDSVTAGVPNGPWSATRLSVALSRTFKLSFGTETNIQIWRHAAIAISRRHLQQAKFKRDFIEAVSWAWNDEMAAHSTKIAGLTYARGLEEAPGHIAGAKAEYRRISQLRLLCCRICQTMVTRKQVKLHLRSAPHSLNSQEISLAQEWASKHDIFEGQLEAHANLPPRPDDAPPIAALGPPGTGGIRCEFIPERSTSSRPNCPYVGAELRRIREHLRVKHDWEMELKGGRRSAAMTDEERSNSPWRTGVCYQRLFSSGPGSELFEVARGLNLEQSRAQDNESQAALQRAVDAFQSKGKDIRSREAERIDEENDFTAPNPWLRRLGSAIHLKDFSGKKDLLRGLIVMEYEVDPDDPDKSDDAQLRFIHIAFDRLVNHAKAVITPDIVSWNALFEVNRKELMKERTKPFHFRFKPETQRRYALVVKQLLAYIVRCMSFENKADRPPFKLSTRQQRAYDATMEHADDLTDAWKENGGDPEAPEIVRLLDLLETAVLELLYAVVVVFRRNTTNLARARCRVVRARVMSVYFVKLP